MWFLCSILYADIVNFTPLTAELQPEDLVRALNELFGRFDELAKVGVFVVITLFKDVRLINSCIYL